MYIQIIWQNVLCDVPHLFYVVYVHAPFARTYPKSVQIKKSIKKSVQDVMCNV